MLMKSKEEIAACAYAAAKNAINTHGAMSYNGFSQSSNSMMGQLTDLIAVAIQAGVMEVLKNTYTNEEFERDLGLKP